MNEHDRIYIAGHRGMVGSAIWRRLEAQGHTNLVGRTRGELDLTDGHAVDAFFAAEKPACVFLAAAKVGGIKANNDYPAEFIRDNLVIQANVIHSAWAHGVTKLAFLGSSCVYPKHAPQPMQEDHLLTGPLEPTNQPYAIAKIAGIEMCRAYRRQYGLDAITLMPTNLYGPGDDFDLETSHVLPALIRRFHEAKARGDTEVTLWGTGTPRREFLHVDDLAAAAVHLMKTYDEPDPINVGVGEDIPIHDLAELVRAVVGADAAIRYDTAMPDGTPRKLLDISRLWATGWRPGIDLETGIRSTYEWFLRQGHAASSSVAEPGANPRAPGQSTGT